MLPVIMKRQEAQLKGKNTGQLEIKRAYDKIYAWFFAFPEGEFSLNDLAEELSISKTTAKAVVQQLVAEGFLEASQLGKMWRIRANQTHQYFRTRKIPFNLRQVYESGVIEWIETRAPNAKAIILFGSYRKGDDNDKSDLDIAIEITGSQKLDIVTVMIQELGYRKNVKASIHFFSRDNIDLNLFASIANGIILSGFLEVKP